MTIPPTDDGDYQVTRAELDAMPDKGSTPPNERTGWSFKWSSADETLQLGWPFGVFVLGCLLVLVYLGR